METLAQLFGSALRVKMMRLFLFNPETVLDVEHIEKKTVSRSKDAERELGYFKKMGLIKQVKIQKTVTVKKGKRHIQQKKKVRAFVLDQKFRFIDALTDFLVKTHSLEYKSIIKKIEKTGRIKAILVSGVFTRDPEARVDMFVVGDNVKTSSIDRIIKSIESDMGKDIRYTVLSAPDFSYRLSMNDKLVRDVLDFPHKVLLDKIGLPAE